MKLLLVAACALVDADGRVLITERPAGKSMAGLTHFNACPSCPRGVPCQRRQT